MPNEQERSPISKGANDSLLQQYKIFPTTQTIAIKMANNQSREFKFNEVFTYSTQYSQIFKKLMIPLLKTVLKDNKDATLISYGAKGTGKPFIYLIYNRQIISSWDVWLFLYT